MSQRGLGGTVGRDASKDSGLCVVIEPRFLRNSSPWHSYSHETCVLTVGWTSTLVSATFAQRSTREVTRLFAFHVRDPRRRPVTLASDVLAEASMSTTNRRQFGNVVSCPVF